MLLINLSTLLLFQYDHEWMQLLGDRLLNKIMNKIPNVIRNGDPEHSYPGCINLSFAYVEGKC